MSLFISLEGPDGGGKSTHALLLGEYLQERGLDVLNVREPGGTPIGDQIRSVLMTLDNKGMSPETEFLLFCASRAQLVREIIRPHLNRDGVVVCDRFYDSSLAYQGYGHQLNLDTLRTVTRFVTGGLTPDLTLLIDLPCEQGLARKKEAGSWNRLDDYDLDFHNRVREGYFALAAADPNRWVTIDASGSVDTIQSQIQVAVEARLT